MGYQNVYFLGVCRIPDQAIIVAHYSHEIDTDLSNVKNVLEQPNMNMSPGKLYNFAVGAVAWHLIKDESDLIYVLICKSDYPQRQAHACLNELQIQFTSKAGEKAQTAKDNSLTKLCVTILKKIAEKYDDLASVDKTHAVLQKVDAVKLKMQENIDVAIQNCVKLESIEKQSEDLQQQAGIFKRNAVELKKKMWWKNTKMLLIMAGLVLVVLAIIIGVAVSYSKAQEKAKSESSSS